MRPLARVSPFREELVKKAPEPEVVHIDAPQEQVSLNQADEQAIYSKADTTAKRANKASEEQSMLTQCPSVEKKKPNAALKKPSLEDKEGE